MHAGHSCRDSGGLGFFREASLLVGPTAILLGLTDRFAGRCLVLLLREASPTGGPQRRDLGIGRLLTPALALLESPPRSRRTGRPAPLPSRSRRRPAVGGSDVFRRARRGPGRGRR